MPLRQHKRGFYLFAKVFARGASNQLAALEVWLVSGHVILILRGFIHMLLVLHAVFKVRMGQCRGQYFALEGSSDIRENSVFNNTNNKTLF